MSPRALAGLLLLFGVAAAPSAAAQSKPITVLRQPANSFDALVPVEDGLRSQGNLAWDARLKRGGAKVTSAQPLAPVRPPVRLEVALAFDISASFKQHIPAAQTLAKRFVTRTVSTGFDPRFSVHTFGIQRTSLGSATTADPTWLLIDKVASQPSQQRTQLRKLGGELIEETGRAVRFPEGVREVVLFTDGGEESAAFSDFAQIIDPATSQAVIVHAVLFQANTPSGNAATLSDKLSAAVERTGGSVVRVIPGQPSAPDTLSRLDSAAALPGTLVRVHVEACGLATTGPGDHDDELSFTITAPGQPAWRSGDLPAKLQVPVGGAPSCAPAPTPSASAAPAPPPITPKPQETSDGPRYWLWALVATAIVAVLALVLLLARRSRTTPAATKVDTAPMPAHPVTTPPPTPTPPPLLVPSAMPWLEKQGANPLARLPATELHVEASAVALGSPLRIARPEVRVGRDPTMELPLDHTSVSHHHATLLVEPDGELFVVDHGSTNGTYLDRQRLLTNQRHRVPPGAELSFSTHIRLRVVQPWRPRQEKT